MRSSAFRRLLARTRSEKYWVSTSTDVSPSSFCSRIVNRPRSRSLNVTSIGPAPVRSQRQTTIGPMKPTPKLAARKAPAMSSPFWRFGRPLARSRVRRSARPSRLCTGTAGCASMRAGSSPPRSAMLLTTIRWVLSCATTDSFDGPLVSPFTSWPPALRPVQRNFGMLAPHRREIDAGLHALDGPLDGFEAGRSRVVARVDLPLLPIPDGADGRPLAVLGLRIGILRLQLEEAL